MKKHDILQNHKGFSKYWNLQQFIGKTVFDNKGQNCGKILSTYIDPETFTISGIIVKKRFSKEYLLSRDYFESLKESGLYLNSIPIKPNDKVVNTEDKKIGKVISINYNSTTNKLESLEIKSGFKSRIIPCDKIIGIGEKITIC